MDLLRSLPIGSYLEQPITWLHKIDPRVKLAWLMTFLLAPLLSNPFWRIGLAASLVLLTIVAGIPWRVWRKQMGWLLLLCSFMFLLSSVAPDSLAVKHQPRIPAYCADVPAITLGSVDQETGKLAQCESSLSQPTSYRYVYFDQPKFAFIPRLVVTRRSLDVAIRISTLIFTLIYSTGLYLLTTSSHIRNYFDLNLISALYSSGFRGGAKLGTFYPNQGNQLEKIGCETKRPTLVNCFGKVIRELVFTSRTNCHSNGCTRFYFSK